MGLGDLVYYILYYTGIHWLVKQINPDCGCDERRSRWNVYKLWRRKQKENEIDLL